MSIGIGMGRLSSAPVTDGSGHGAAGANVLKGWAREQCLILVPAGSQRSALLRRHEVPDFGQYAGDAIGALAEQNATIADALIAATLRDSVWKLFTFYGEWMESRGASVSISYPAALMSGGSTPGGK